MEEFFAKVQQNEFTIRELDVRQALAHCLFICLLALFLTMSNAYEFATDAGQVEVGFIWLAVVGTSTALALVGMRFIQLAALTELIHPLLLFVCVSATANLASTIVLVTAMYLLSWPIGQGWMGTFVSAYFNGLLPVTIMSFVYWTLILKLPFGFSSNPLKAETDSSTGCDDPKTDGTASTRAFQDRLPKNVQGDVLCLRADDHYLHVYTTQGKCVILHRFGDAVAQLDTGIQVHRSWWVGTTAVNKYEKNGRRVNLVLNNDLKVPVSESYQSKARKMWSHL